MHKDQCMGQSLKHSLNIGRSVSPASPGTALYIALEGLEHLPGKGQSAVSLMSFVSVVTRSLSWHLLHLSLAQA